MTPISILCTRCSQVRSINANDPLVYTEEMRARFVCLFCREKGANVRIPKMRPPEPWYQVKPFPWGWFWFFLVVFVLVSLIGFRVASRLDKKAGDGLPLFEARHADIGGELR